MIKKVNILSEQSSENIKNVNILNEVKEMIKKVNTKRIG
jgi:hypothetical protein